MSQSIESKFFHVVYDEKDTNIIDRILSVIDSTYENVIRPFDLEKSSAVFTLYICRDVQSFKRLTGKSDEEYQEWMYTNGSICRRSLWINTCMKVLKKMPFRDC